MGRCAQLSDGTYGLFDGVKGEAETARVIGMGNLGGGRGLPMVRMIMMVIVIVRVVVRMCLRMPVGVVVRVVVGRVRVARFRRVTRRAGGGVMVSRSDGDRQNEPEERSPHDEIGDSDRGSARTSSCGGQGCGAHGGLDSQRVERLVR